jgi:hypothetical protein
MCQLHRYDGQTGRPPYECGECIYIWTWVQALRYSLDDGFRESQAIMDAMRTATKK